MSFDWLRCGGLHTLVDAKLFPWSNPELIVSVPASDLFSFSITNWTLSPHLLPNVSPSPLSGTDCPRDSASASHTEVSSRAWDLRSVPDVNPDTSDYPVPPIRPFLCQSSTKRPSQDRLPWRRPFSGPLSRSLVLPRPQPTTPSTRPPSFQSHLPRIGKANTVPQNICTTIVSTGNRRYRLGQLGGI